MDCVHIEAYVLECLSTSSIPHVPEPGMAPRPAAHGVQLDAPAEENVSTGHSLHIPGPAALKVPLTHGTQDDSL